MENILKIKSYTFALRIVRLSQSLVQERNEYVLSKQILKSGTSIGALIREAEFAQSKLDFINKMSIALKEANETDYWINILKDTGYIQENIFKSLLIDCQELLKLLITTIKTAKNSIIKNNEFKTVAPKI